MGLKASKNHRDRACWSLGSIPHGFLKNAPFLFKVSPFVIVSSNAAKFHEFFVFHALPCFLMERTQTIAAIVK